METGFIRNVIRARVNIKPVRAPHHLSSFHPSPDHPSAPIARGFITNLDPIQHQNWTHSSISTSRKPWPPGSWRKSFKRRHLRCELTCSIAAPMIRASKRLSSLSIPLRAYPTSSSKSGLRRLKRKGRLRLKQRSPESRPWEQQHTPPQRRGKSRRGQGAQVRHRRRQSGR